MSTMQFDRNAFESDREFTEAVRQYEAQIAAEQEAQRVAQQAAEQAAQQSAEQDTTDPKETAKERENLVYNQIDTMISEGQDPVVWLKSGAEAIRDALGQTVYARLLKYAEDAADPTGINLDKILEQYK